jgi:AcrR family transcriptional regulator
MVKLLNEQKHTDQRLRLLSHARRLIANQGFKETTMAQIAKACKVTKAGLYHYFKSKEAILLAILGCHEDEMDSLKKELAQARHLEEVLYAIARNHMEKMNRNENLDFLKILVNEAMTNPEVKKFYLDFIKDSLTMVAKDILSPFVKGKMSEVEIRRTYFQFVAALAHYTWQVKMVGGLSDIIGDDESYIRLLARVYANQFMSA